MNYFDSIIIDYLNRFSNQSLIFDKLMVALVDQNLLKGGIFAGIIWWLWFRTGNEIENHSMREHLISSIVGCFVSLFTARILALTLPFRLRPIHNPDINFVLPYEMMKNYSEGWSSFPSDHAVMFFNLVFSFWFISKNLSFFSLIYAFFIIFFPRIYTGIHYPTDILGGAVLGFVFAWIFNIYKIRHNVARPFFYLLNRVPGFFYFSFFIVTYQIANLFGDIRIMSQMAFKLVFKYLFNIIS